LLFVEAQSSRAVFSFITSGIIKMLKKFADILAGYKSKILGWHDYRFSPL
jgi:hypothetical protein